MKCNFMTNMKCVSHSVLCPICKSRVRISYHSQPNTIAGRTLHQQSAYVFCKKCGHLDKYPMAIWDLFFNAVDSYVYKSLKAKQEPSAAAINKGYAKFRKKCFDNAERCV